MEVHINNTRLMWSLAPELNVLVIFAGHRYESESFPDLVGMSDCIRHCTSPERALAIVLCNHHPFGFLTIIGSTRSCQCIDFGLPRFGRG